MMEQRADLRPISPEQAGAFVRARLGRAPQDALEAAVVLEAWGGVRSGKAVDLAVRIMAIEAGHQPPAGRGVDERAAAGAHLGFADYVGLVLIVAVVAAWSAPLAAQLDGPTVSVGWRIALPLSLCLQWVIRRRYLSGGSQLGSLRRGGVFLVTTTAAVAIVPGLILGAGGVLASMLVVTWVGAMLIALRGWALAFALALLSVAVAVRLELPALVSLGGLAIATAIVTVVAIVTSPETADRPSPWIPSIESGVIGLGIGLILVSDPGVGWGIRGSLPVLAFLPSFTGGLWASLYLRSIWRAVPAAASSTPLGTPERPPLWDDPTKVLAGALVRLFGAVALLSWVVVVAAVAQGAELTTVLNTIVGFAVVVLAGLIAGLLDACNETGRALLAVVTGDIAVLLARSIPGIAARPGATLIIGGAAVVLVSLPFLVELVRRPGRRLATALLIP
jgi:hypothetical protein